MSGDLDVIRRIIDAFERSDWAEIDVRAGSLRVHLSVGAHPERRADAGETSAASATPAAPEVGGEADAEIENRREPQRPTDVAAGAHLVVSPSPGIFWRSPYPGAPPFARVGDHVGPSSTVCIVEIMKLMTHVKSEVAGAVVGVLVDDGTRVDQGDPLFAIAPES